MAKLKVSGDLFPSPEYGTLAAAERALMWELLALSDSKLWIKISDAEWKLSRRQVKIQKSVNALVAAGLAELDGDKVRITCSFVQLESKAEYMAGRRAVKREKSAQAPAEPAPQPAAVEPAPVAPPAPPAKAKRAPKAAPEPQAPLTYELPDYVDQAEFERYLIGRAKSCKGPMSQSTMNRLIEQIKDAQADGKNVNQLIGRAADGGNKGTWGNIYYKESKEESSGSAPRGAFAGTGPGRINPNAARGRVAL